MPAEPGDEYQLVANGAALFGASMSGWTITGGNVTLRRSTWKLIGKEMVGDRCFLMFRCSICKRQGCAAEFGEPSPCVCQASK